MQRDIRQTDLYAEAERIFTDIWKPGSGQITDISDVRGSPDGTHAAFAGVVARELQGAPTTRIGEVNLGTGEVRVLTAGLHSDRLPKYSPDGYQLAFLSDRHRMGDFQLHILDRRTAVIRSTPSVDGWVEYFHWSHDGTRILLGVAGHGADIAGGQGAVRTEQRLGGIPSWMPQVEAQGDVHRWRRIWIYTIDADHVRCVTPQSMNVWEAAWCGDHSFASVFSPEPDEGDWYTSRLCVTDIITQEIRELYAPRDQLGCLSASPSGRDIAIVEAICSDRGIVAGNLLLVDKESHKITRVNTRDVDVTHIEWRSDHSLLVAGHRGPSTVVGLYDGIAKKFTELWKSEDISSIGRCACVSGLNDIGDCVIGGEGFLRTPEIAVIRNRQYQCVSSFEWGPSDYLSEVDCVEPLSWRSPDGLEIQGWLIKPKMTGPFPLIMNIHGGPVASWRPSWLGRGALLPMLLKRGYAVFLPNPRGSSGRGQEFIRKVVGDIGGADTHDHLAGIDALVDRGLINADRLGVMGGSYGGFMTSWLITQDERFSAAVAIAPHTNQVTQHLLSNIPHFVKLFLMDDYTNPGGKYFQRSPIMFAHKVRTPVLNICGLLDRCTPPEEAMQFHNALLQNKIESVLLSYPEEGHGIRKLPGAIDFSARIVWWFEKHLTP